MSKAEEQMRLIAAASGTVEITAMDAIMLEQ